MPTSHPGEVGRQLRVRLGAQVVDVGRRWQRRPDRSSTIGPTRSTSCQSGRAAATDATSSRSNRSSMTPNQPSRGCPMDAWSAGSSTALRARAKCARSTLLAKRWTAGWRLRLERYSWVPPVNTRSARDEQPALLDDQLGRCAPERGQLVHAVVHHGGRGERVAPRRVPSVSSTSEPGWLTPLDRQQPTDHASKRDVDVGRRQVGWAVGVSPP